MKKIVDLGLGFAVCLVVLISLVPSVNAQACCVAVMNGVADRNGISGQFRITNVDVGTAISYNWILYWKPAEGSVPASCSSLGCVVGRGSSSAGNVESPGIGVFTFKCQLQSTFQAGYYQCALTPTAQGGEGTYSTAYTNSYSIS